jgi:hypothetical protein
MIEILGIKVGDISTSFKGFLTERSIVIQKQEQRKSKFNFASEISNRRAINRQRGYKKDDDVDDDPETGMLNPQKSVQ